jgi:hypothetical protein
MQITFTQVLAQVTTLVAVLFFIAVAAERLVEIFQPLIKAIKSDPIRTMVNILAGAAAGTLATWGMALKIQDYLTFIPGAIPAYANYIILGVAAGAGGSAFWHAVLGYIGQIKLPTVPPTLPTT